MAGERETRVSACSQSNQTTDNTVKHDSVFLHHHVYFYFCYPSICNIYQYVKVCFVMTNV